SELARHRCTYGARRGAARDSVDGAAAGDAADGDRRRPRPPRCRRADASDGKLVVWRERDGCDDLFRGRDLSPCDGRGRDLYSRASRHARGSDRGVARGLSSLSAGRRSTTDQSRSYGARLRWRRPGDWGYQLKMPPRPDIAPHTAVTDLSRDELLRYSRHLTLPDVGLEGQKRIKAARILLIGAGGLGSPAALYLAAAGVGTLGLVDFDVVDATNLQRQVLHGTSDVGRPKLDSARDR